MAAFRRFASARLREWDLAQLTDTAELLVSELVTNAVTYAATPVRLHLARHEDYLHVDVLDGDHRIPVRRIAANEDEHGRGLFLVQALAHAWGTHAAAAGKAVWFELPTAKLA